MCCSMVYIHPEIVCSNCKCHKSIRGIGLFSHRVALRKRNVVLWFKSLLCYTIAGHHFSPRHAAVHSGHVTGEMRLFRVRSIADRAAVTSRRLHSGETSMSSNSSV